MSNETGQNKGETGQNKDVYHNTWPGVIRDLIKHENDLINNRVGWMLTYQGFLFAALAFSWDKRVAGGVSLLAVLCVFGSFQAALSFWALFKADTAIRKLLKEWNTRAVPQIGFNWKDTIPPIWGWVDTEINIGKRVLTAPWLWLPSMLVIGWIFIYLWFDEPHSEPLTGQWQSRAEENLYKALSGEEKSNNEVANNKEQAISVLTLIHGKADEGKKVFFDKGCSKCHSDSGNSDDTIPKLTDLSNLSKFSRERIIRGILYPNPHLEEREEKLKFINDIKYMESGIATRMHAEELIHVVEYLQDPDGKQQYGRLAYLPPKPKLEDRLPIIPIADADKRHFFASGSAALTPAFDTDLQTIWFKKIAYEVLRRNGDGKLNVDTLEIIGHTDGVAVSSRSHGNLDTLLPLMLGGDKASITRLEPCSNNDLGLLRALAIKRAWQRFVSEHPQRERLEPISVRTYSAGQTLPVKVGAFREEDASSRRIELRLTKLPK